MYTDKGCANWLSNLVQATGQMKLDRTPAHCRDDWAGIDSRWSPVEMTRCWAIGELESGSLELLDSPKNVGSVGTGLTACSPGGRLYLAQDLTFLAVCSG